MTAKYGVWATGIYVPGKKHRTLVKYGADGRPVRVVRKAATQRKVSKAKLRKLSK